MRDMVQKTDENSRTMPISAQTHDLRSLWNYFFDFGGETMAGLQPKIDVTEQKNAVLVTAEIPGINEADLDLKISDDGYLTISGQKEQKAEQTGTNNYFQEISYGMFKRTIPHILFSLSFLSQNDLIDSHPYVRDPKSHSLPKLRDHIITLSLLETQNSF